MPGAFLWGCYNKDTRDWRPVAVNADGSIIIDIVRQDRGNVFNTAYLTPANILGAAITPNATPSLFRIQCAFNAAGVLTATLAEGGAPVTVDMNRAVPLLANSLYTLDLVAGSVDAVNFQYSQNCTILTFKVVESPAMV